MQNWEAMEQTAYNHNWFSNMIAKRTAESPKSPTITSDFNPFMMGNKFHPIDMTSSASTFLRSDGADNKPAGYYDNQPNIIHNSIGFNPLTPPGYPNPIIPRINFNHDIIKNESTNNSNVEKKTSTTPPPTTITPKVEPTDPLTPSHTPPLDNISSTKFRNETPEHTDNSSSCNEFGEEMQFSEPEQDDSIRTPKFNSHGKVKQFKCKQCGFVAFTKVEFWEHNKVHMKPEKALQCKLCPFVTELKHHLEYHIRKHNNLKPFNCNRCSYTCVNKSMLNSHLKSHSEVFQFNCADCNYATKYCHSFKMHLRKHSHKPGVCLNEDGSPNPDMIIDVYGTRRGPKMKSANRLNHNRAKNLIKNERKFLISQQQKQEQEKQQQQQQEQQQQQQQQKQEEELQQRLQQQQQQQHHQQLLSGLQQMIPQPLSSPLLSMPSPLTSLTCPLLPFDNPQSQAMMTALTGIIPYINDWNLSILATHAILARLPLNLRRAALKALCTIVNNEYDFNEDTTESECDEKVEDDKTEPIENVVMDLSQSTELEQPPQFGTPPSVNTVKPNRRKGRAFKL